MKLIASINNLTEDGNMNYPCPDPTKAVEALGWKMGTQHPHPQEGYFEIEIPDGLIEGKFFKGHDSEYSALFYVTSDLKPVDIITGIGFGFDYNNRTNSCYWEIEIGDPENETWCPSETTWVGEGRH